MKRLLITAVLAVGLAGPAAAQDLFGVIGVLDTGVANLYTTSVTLVRGNATATTVNLANTINGLTTGLAAGTPAEPLAEQGVQLSNLLVVQSLPITQLLTAQGKPVVVLLRPLADAYIANARALRDGLPLSNGLIALGTADGGFQAFLVNAGIPGVSDLFALFPAFPVFDGSSFSLPGLAGA